jgi:predicted ArsR family transcriptional regulator
VQKLELLVKEIKQRSLRKKLNQLEKEKAMPMGKGTYGSQRGRPAKKSTLTGKQKTLPASLKKKILASKKKK